MLGQRLLRYGEGRGEGLPIALRQNTESMTRDLQQFILPLLENFL